MEKLDETFREWVFINTVVEAIQANGIGPIKIVR
jgi:hypothetical protein